MIKNFFTIAWRNLRKNILFSGINILGLTVAITACLLIGIYIQHELSYDKFNVNADRIIRVTMEYKSSGTVNATQTTGTKVGPHFKRLFPQIQEYVRTFISSSVIKKDEKVFDESLVLFADPAFFKIFSFNIITGDVASALDAPDKIVLTRSMAEKYFGQEDPVGKTLTALGKDLVVSAVCEDAPRESQIKFDFVTQFMNLSNVKEETWWNANWTTYLLLDDMESISKLQAGVNRYMELPDVRKETNMSGNDYLSYNLEPLTRVHLYSSLDGFEPKGSIANVYVFLIIAILILIIASSNYTNLSIAQSAGRSNEVGMRKAMGASRMQVFIQFMSESYLFALIASVLALLLACLLIPSFNNITGKNFTTSVLLQPEPIIMLTLFSFVVSVLAGSYPAIILSGTRIMDVLKKGFSFTGGSNFIRKGLIVTQFAISLFLIVYTIVVLQQVKYMHGKNLGYNKDHVLVLPIAGKMLNEFENLKHAFEQVPGVVAVTAAYETPEYVGWGDGITAIDENGEHKISLNAMPVDLDFTKTMQMRILAGRDFLESDFALMDTANGYQNFSQPYIINKTLANELGWKPEESVGRIITKNEQGPVVGVIEDFHFSSLHDPVGPLLIFLGRNYSRTFMLRISGNNMKETINQLETTWKQRIPGRPFNYHFLEEDYNKLYVAEQRTSALFSMASGLAILLACLGLFCLAAFTTMQRTKEIGIRRILGATLVNVTMLISKSFLVLITIGVVIAIPLALWAAHNWLQDFAYRIEISWWYIALAGVTVLAIALATVSFQAIKAALAKPVNSLRSE